MNATPKTRGRNLAVAAVLLVLIVVAFGLRFHALGADEAKASIRSVQENEGIPVETTAVETGALSKWITLAGTVEGKVQYPIVSNNALQVLEIMVREGDRVEAGDVIIRLAEGAPSPMVHSLDKSRASYDNALLNAKRMRNLFAEGAVSQADLDGAETALTVAEADLVDARDSKDLIASEAGTVSSILVEVGETVDAGHELAWITDTSQVKVKFSAGSRQALVLDEGQAARWTTPNGETRNGHVDKLDLMADPKTHLLGGEAVFDNADGVLVPGLLISFEVRTHHREEALILPAGCLIDRDGADAVWTASATAELVEVGVGLRTVDNVEILTGLHPRQQVVQFGQTLLSEGAKIKVVAAVED